MNLLLPALWLPDAVGDGAWTVQAPVADPGGGIGACAMPPPPASHMEGTATLLRGQRRAAGRDGHPRCAEVDPQGGLSYDNLSFAPQGLS